MLKKGARQYWPMLNKELRRSYKGVISGCVVVSCSSSSSSESMGGSVVKRMPASMARVVTSNLVLNLHKAEGVRLSSPITQVRRQRS